MNPAQLGNIEERLLKAKMWPWIASPQADIITTNDRKKARAILRRSAFRDSQGPGDLSGVDHDHVDQIGILLLKGPGADRDTMLFVAHAPEDVEALISAVRPLQHAVERLEARERELLEENRRLRDALAERIQKANEHESFMRMLKEKLRDVV